MPIYGAAPQTTVTQKTVISGTALAALFVTPVTVFSVAGLVAPVAPVSVAYFYDPEGKAGTFVISDTFVVKGSLSGTVFFTTAGAGVLATPAAGYGIFSPGTAYLAGLPSAADAAFILTSSGAAVGTKFGSLTVWVTAAVGGPAVIAA